MTVSSDLRSGLLLGAFLALSALSGSALAQCPGDDATTTNNDCSSPAPLPIGTTTGLAAQLTVNDYWTFDIPPGQSLTVDALFTHHSGDIDLVLYGDPGTCLVVHDTSNSVTNNEQVVYGNNGNAPITVTLFVLLWSGSTDNCNDYVLAASLTPLMDPCLGAMDDAEEDNDSCAAAVVPSSNPLLGAFVSESDRDYYSLVVPGQTEITINAQFVHALGNVNLRLTNGADCTTFLGLSADQNSDSEQIVFENITNDPINTVLEVRTLFLGVLPTENRCNTYDLSWSFDVGTNPCSGLPDDAEEPNDTCQTAVVPSASVLTGLFISEQDPDYYSITIPSGMELDVEVNSNVGSGVEFEILDPSDCSTVLAALSTFGRGNQLALTNVATTPRDVVVHVYRIPFGGPNDCGDYDLTWSLTPSACLTNPDDGEEENDTCSTAVVPSSDQLTGLYLSAFDEDHYLYSLDPGEVLNVNLMVGNPSGQVAMQLLASDCATVLGTATSDFTGQGNLAYTNSSGGMETVILGLSMDGEANIISPCMNYDLSISSEPPFVPYCFGDGSGTTCPCGNNSSPGHVGGCANAQGDGAVLSATGVPSTAADTMSFGISLAEPNSFALLVSAQNLLPQTGPCVGCGILAFDGLRCAGGDFLRHGTRGTDANGDTVSTWGSSNPASGSLIQTNGWVPGQTRNFFVFYRSDLTATCMSGRNTSNGISVVIQP